MLRDKYTLEPARHKQLCVPNTLIRSDSEAFVSHVICSVLKKVPQGLRITWSSPLVTATWSADSGEPARAYIGIMKRDTGLGTHGINQ